MHFYIFILALKGSVVYRTNGYDLATHSRNSSQIVKFKSTVKQVMSSRTMQNTAV